MDWFIGNTGQILFYILTAFEMSHEGVDKTVHNNRNSYWFPEMKSRVENHLKSCLKCIAFARRET